MQALIAKFALAAAVAPHAIPPADQSPPPQTRQQQQTSGDATEQKGETPATTQASPTATEPKPDNATRAGTMTQTNGTAMDTSIGPSRAAIAPTAMHRAGHAASKSAHHRRRHRKAPRHS